MEQYARVYFQAVIEQRRCLVNLNLLLANKQIREECYSVYDQGNPLHPCRKSKARSADMDARRCTFNSSSELAQVLYI
jgi:hypothetical protein